MKDVRLGIRANLAQFSLLVVVNAFVGGMVGIERSILPALGLGGGCLPVRAGFRLRARRAAGRLCGRCLRHGGRDVDRGGAEAAIRSDCRSPHVRHAAVTASDGRSRALHRHRAQAACYWTVFDTTLE